ncbi:PaaI family thioesterase [Sporosarcina sp. P13]|uniref:PaaI family thioesterase n=1 Tax=Sporosarcina sp. P13 TaxID=2048263 RepID=UPI001303F6DE|nr:PaaI family thioesterase [Sporosarcina sp. P13]
MSTLMQLNEVKEEFIQSPYVQHLGIQITKFEEGDVQAKLAVHKSLLNFSETVNGGVIASVLDIIQSMQLRSVIKKRCLTVNLNINYIAPIMTETIYAEATITSKTYNTAFMEGVIKDANGNIISTATGVFKILHEKN